MTITRFTARLSGHEAVSTAVSLGKSICLYASPVFGPRADVPPDEAAEILGVDPDLVYADLGPTTSTGLSVDAPDEPHCDEGEEHEWEPDYGSGGDGCRICGCRRLGLVDVAGAQITQYQPGYYLGE